MIGLATLVAAAGVAAVLALHDRYAIHWDEPVHAMYGDLVREWFATGGDDARCLTFLNMSFYGPLLDLIPACVRPLHDLELYDLRHLLCGLLAVATAVLLVRLAASVGDAALGLLAVAALVGMPRFVGHAFVNLKDVGFAVAVAAWMTVLAHVAIGRRLTWVVVGWLGAGLGFLLAVRPGGLPVAVILALGALLLSDVTRSRRRALGERVVLRIAAVFLLGWLVMVLPWPAAWIDPITHPLLSMAMAQRFHFSPEVLFRGEVMRSIELPHSYLPTFLLVATPVPTLLAAAAGVIAMSRRAWTRPRSRRTLWSTLLLLWLFAPLTAALVLRPNLYDGLRQFLFLLPAMALCAAVGVVTLARLLPGRARAAAMLIGGVALLSSAPTMARLHPYEMTYFNRTVGGLAGAEGRYDTDYWVLAYREALAWIDGEHAGESPPRVLLAGSGYVEPIGRLYLGRDAVVETVEESGSARVPDGFDFLVATSRFGFSTKLFPESPVVHRVERDGVVLAVVRAR